MAFGISVYPGLDNTREENISLIQCAAHHGVSKLFTSLHIPEGSKESFREDLQTILKTARVEGMQIIADVTPESASALQLPACTPEEFFKAGIDILRLDDGFDTAQIAEFSRNGIGAKIQLNASVISQSLLTELSSHDADFSHIEAMHNFYPRQGTGLSLRAFKEKTALLRRFGIQTGAFIPTKDGKTRSPLHEGLPSLEMHRNFPPGLAARHLSALGIDDIFLSDSLPTEEEIKDLTNTEMDIVTIHAVPAVKSDHIRKLLSEPFSARPDEARDAVRTVESRSRTKKIVEAIPPDHTVSRPFGTVTLDNDNYLRYAGELQIAKRPLPADARTNVIAYIRKEEQFLIPLIRPGQKFRIILDE